VPTPFTCFKGALRIAFLRQILNALGVLADLLTQHLGRSSGLSASAFSGFTLRALHPRRRLP
jgi:hypothetical protein